jgi:hypothetical protein
MPPLPAVPLTTTGALDPTDLPRVLDDAFLDPFRLCEWATDAVQMLDRAREHYLDIFFSWRQSPSVLESTDNSPSPSAPTIHDVIESLLVLKAGERSPATITSHAQLQSSLNHIKMGPEENRRMHQLHERYPLLTLSTASKLIVQSAESNRTSLIAGAIDGTHVDPAHLSIDVGAKAMDQLKRLDELEVKTTNSEKTKASKKHVVLSTVLSLVGTVVTAVLLYELKIKGLGGDTSSTGSGGG